MYSTITILGYLGRDPEFRYTPTGTAVCSFSVATSRAWTNPSGEQQKETTWYKVTIWNKMAENVSQFLHKGSLVFVEGSIKPDPETGNPRIWTRQDGTAAASYEIHARIVRVINRKDDQHAEAQPADDIPF